MKRRKIGELNMPNIPGIFLIYEEDKDINPYSIYYKYHTWEKVSIDGETILQPKLHKKLVERYGDFRSVMWHMKDMAFGDVYGKCFPKKGV